MFIFILKVKIYVDFPQYAKSGRAKCKGCKMDIPKGDLRIAAMIQVCSVVSWMLFIVICLNNVFFQSPFFDGKQANWFHWNCFFSRNRPKAVGEIAHFDSLR